MENQEKPKNIPTVFVIFGATGDLMSRKIVPALYHLYTKDKLPKLLKIIGFSRRSLSQKEFQKSLRTILQNHSPRFKNQNFEGFLKLFDYHQGNFDDMKSYKNLAEKLGRIDGEWKVCSNKLFYLAVPPQFYKNIFESLASSGLTIPCGPEEGWTRILVEKPFGHDLKTAQELDLLLAKLFKEEQLYRIDHYLAKEMLQNILSFRFANSIFEEVWNKDYIEKIELRLLEDLDVESRKGFYNDVGALRDVGQNHLLQMLSLVTMNQPQNLVPEGVRPERAKVLEALHILNATEIKSETFRGQYSGYRKSKDIPNNSQTETYFKIKASIDNQRWNGVPVILESGKNLVRKKEIIVTFKHPTPCLCPKNGPHYQNRVIFSVEPKETIHVEIWVKKPGLEYQMEKQTLNFLYRDNRKKVQFVEEYEKLLLDCIMGNQLLFVSTDEVQATWKFIDPILTSWHKNYVPLVLYKPHSKEIFKLSAKIDFSLQTLMRREVGVIGLGKMGGSAAKHLVDKGWRVIGYNRTADDIREFEGYGGEGAYSIPELIKKLSSPRVVLLSLPSGRATDEMIDLLLSQLSKGDIIIDGANALYKASAANFKKCKAKGIHYLDAGISGGPGGARTGACIMVGGEKAIFEKVKPLFIDMATENGVQFFEGAGAGHFVKMVHNGIEYGMMQALAEGFAILKKSPYKLDLKRVADIYNHKSVIESRLVGWLQKGFDIFGEDLEGVSPTVAHTGEGAWTVETGKELGVITPVISDSLQFRVDSAKNPSYTGRVLSALRNMFGGHSIK